MVMVMAMVMVCVPCDREEARTLLQVDEDSCMTLQGRLLLIDVAIRIIEDTYRTLFEEGISNEFRVSMLAFFCSALRLGTHQQSADRDGATKKLFQIIEEVEEASRKSYNQMGVDSKAFDPPVEKAAAFLAFRRPALELLCRENQYTKWRGRKVGLTPPIAAVTSSSSSSFSLSEFQSGQSKDHGVGLEVDRKRVYSARKAETTLFSEEKHHSARSIKETFDSVLREIERHVQNVKTNDGFVHNHEAMKNYNLYCRLLSDPKTFAGRQTWHRIAGSFYDIDSMKGIMDSISKLDRLPVRNSLEALRTLRDAWNYVEAFSAAARTYKLITKTAYDLLLLVGVAITLAALLDFQYGICSK
eukprot:gene38514-52031_t